MSRNKAQLPRTPVRRHLKSKLLTLVLCGLVLAPAICPQSQAVNGGPMATAVDVIVARPISFVATIVGSALFVVSLPISLTSGSVKETAHVLVEAPAKDTFIRPVGDLDDFMSYY